MQLSLRRLALILVVLLGGAAAVLVTAGTQTAVSAGTATATTASTPVNTATPHAAIVPIPDVSPALPVTATSYPFGAANETAVPEDLSKVGYEEHEYLVSGRANVYTWPAPGPAEVRTANAPYTTRILVRQPEDPRRFSGRVVVEMLNPSNLFDLNIGWAMMHRQMIRDGDAWVGITAKPISIDALKTFDPERYAKLSMANPLPLTDPSNCQTVASDSSRTTENGLVWDIYSQVGVWVRSNAASNPLSRGHSRVKKVYGFGYSQTGGYMYDYINAISPIARRAGGKPIYDGYIVAVAGGAFVGAVPINQCEPAPPVGDPRRQFHDVGVPIIHIMSQSDYLAGIASRRPDSDVMVDRYRGYEMAGAGHATPDELYYAAKPADILKAGRAVPPASCNEGPRSRFPSWMFFDAALRNLDAWVSNGVKPPSVSPITVQNGAPVLDQYGNVQGGLRSPFLDVPTSVWSGTSTGASFCFIAGHESPFSPTQLHALYSSQADYVSKVQADVNGLVDQGVITQPDGDSLAFLATQTPQIP